MSARQHDVVVVGAGVVGMTAALELLRAGRQVTLADPAVPGSGASWGNAGTIANYAVLPLGGPGILRALPGLLLARDSPLSLPARALPGRLPWLGAFAWNCLPGPAARNAAALAELLSGAGPAWRRLAAAVGAEDCLRETGCLYRYDTVRARAAAAPDAEARRRLGVRVEDLDAGALAALEPHLPRAEGGAHFFPDALSLTDPGEVMARLARTLRGSGAEFLSEEVRGLHIPSATASVLIDCASGARLLAEHVVIAAGAASAPLARQAGMPLILDTERGYHLEYEMETPLLSRPVSFAGAGIYAVPMSGRLRVTGLVELGGLTLPPDPARWDQIDRAASSYFPGLPPPDRCWMGFRPSVPQTVPVLRRGGPGGRATLATGHGHLGLTLAPVTAAALAGLLA